MMHDDQHIDFDLQMKSILESGQEEVPARVWDGVASGLDKIAHRKKVVLWWRRATISVAAAAAVVAGVIVSTHSPADISGDEILAESKTPEQHIQVVEQPECEIFIAQAEPQSVRPTALVAPKSADEAKSEAISTPEDIEARAEAATKEAVEDTRTQQDAPTELKNTSSVNNGSAAVGDNRFADVWKDETPKKKPKVALVLSGIAGTNSSSQNGKPGTLRRPTLTSAPVETGVEEVEKDNIYGIPLSFGIGAKVNVAKRWSIGAGVNYTLLTRRFTGDYRRVEDGVIVEDIRSEIRNLQHYVGIPVNVYYDIIAREKINFYAYAGGSVEKCVANEFQILESTIMHKEKVQGVQWSANLGIGVEFMLGKHLGLYLDPSARYYFKGNQPKSIRTSQPLMLGFEFGLRTRF